MAGETTFREVRATFSSSDQMQDAVGRLSVAGFDRADISMPDASDTSQPASTNEDARQLRTLGASTAASVAAMAAAGITVATGGLAAAAAGAAVLAGGAAGGAAYAVQNSANDAEQQDRDQRADAGALVLTVRAPNAMKQAHAEAVLRACGGADIEVFEQE